MSRRVVLEDASTGLEIIGFIRAGRWIYMLRDPYTKRFVRRCRRFEVRYIMELNYEGRKGNNLYIDALIATVMYDPPQDLLEDARKALETELSEIIRELFGLHVAGMMEERGYEYRSEPEYEYDFPSALAVIIWYHSVEEKAAPHTKEVEVELRV